MNITKEHVRARIKAAEKELEEARRMVADEMHRLFDSDDARAIAQAQNACERAFEELERKP